MANSADSSTATPRKRRSLLREIVFETKSAWVSIMMFSLVINLMMLVPAVYNLQIFDRVMSSRNMATLAAISAIALVLLAISAALEWARSRIMVRIGVRLDRALGQRLLKLSHRLGIEKNGGAGQQLTHDLSQIRNFLTGQSILAALDIPWVPIFLFVVFMLHPMLAMIMLGSGLFLTLLTLMTEKAIKKPLDRATHLSAEAARFSSIHMRNAEVIESMGMLGSMAARWQGKQDEYLRQQAVASDRAGLLQAISKGVRVINQSMTMGFGAFLSIQGEMSMGAMIAASLLAGRILAPVEQFIASWSMWGNALGAWKRVDEALQYPEKVYSGVKLPPPKGEVALEGLSGCAPSSNTPFVKNVSLKIPAGSSVAIVGPSASGKSSLLRLIAGVWLPQAGVVRIDGSDIQTWPREDLGPFVGYLPQDVELIEGSVAENIARHAEVDSDKVIAAATAAGVHEMILRLPNGYGTQVGVNGAYLSGGQRQRVGLARALYGDPPLLILDEPNSNLDEAGEIALDKALTGAKKRGQTVLIVSHRPIAIRNCDLVMVMQAGQVSLYGPREPVMTALANAAKVAGGAAVVQKTDKVLDQKAAAKALEEKVGADETA
ncbi:alkaline protease secretion ATP-binding protein AprD [Rhodocyclaceae bacterium]